MKKIILFLLFNLSLFACTGDCLTCHPSLVPTINEDLRHKPMQTCIRCHSANPNSMAECGNDCFACHSMEKINKPNVREHDVIQGCRDCHVGQVEEMLSLPQSNDGFNSGTQPLKEFLLN